MEYVYLCKKGCDNRKERWNEESTREKELSAMKWRSEQVLMNLFFYKKKSNLQENTEKIYVIL